MRTRLAIVLILISGTLAGVFGANILVGSSATLTTGTTQTRVQTVRFHGRVSAHRRSRNFIFSVPATAAVEARLRWGNDHAQLRESLHHGRATVSTSSLTHGRHREIREYVDVFPDPYRLHVNATRGRSRFRAVVTMTWTETRPSPTPSPTSSATTGTAGAEGATGSTGSTGSAPAVDQSVPPVWAAAFMDTSQLQVSEAQALAQARTFNVIVGTKGMYRPWAAEMRAANPKLLLLVYLNGTFSMNDAGSNYPSTWYERDASGNKVRSVQFGNYLMDVSNPGWIGDVQNRCASYKSASGYDGCFLDTLGTAPLNPNYVTGLPVNLATHTTWTKQDWLSATEHIAAVSGSVVSPAPVYGNGIANGMKYFEADGGATERILDGARGAMVELFLRAPTTSVTYYEKESQWLQEVQMLQDSAARGSVLLTMTKVWTTATQAQKDSWHRFALSSFLLGYTPGYDWFSFRYDHVAQYDTPYWHAKIGTPTGTFAKSGGVYQRAFTNGRVLVNPTTSAVTVSLGAGAWTNLQGNAVSGTMTLPAHAGDVLTNA
jgi:hypothetical protein